MKEKIVLITGATAGIGKACALELARRRATVVGISRNAEKCARVASELRKLSGNHDIEFLQADLSSQAEVRRVSEEFKRRYPRLHVLVNNAGGIFLRRSLTVDGIEKTFALNHLSYFLLTHLLLDLLKESAPSRIVNVSSSSNYRGKIHFSDLQLEKGYQAFKAYQQSKLANIMFTYELARRLEGTGVTANALHPGLVRTDIAQDNGFLVRFFQRLYLRNALSPEEGAETMVYLASSQEVEGLSGKFYIRNNPVRSNERSYNQEDARRLWDVSARMVGILGPSPVSS